MIRAPGILLIGSTGRNTGKTLFAESVISRLSTDHRIVGLKVTTIHGDGKKCPRGGEGCGVCGSIDGGFELSVEANCDSAKDTSRMLRAGADRVYWLRTRENALADGLEAFLREVTDSELTVCELNTLRSVVEPDLFLMINRKDVAAVKKSAGAVFRFVDRAVEFDESAIDKAGHGEKVFDFDPGEILVVDGQFAIKRTGAAVLLAGGGSRRMGSDKRYLELDGQTLIASAYRKLCSIFDEVIVSSNDQPDDVPESAVVADRIPGIGPIGGIATCLKHASSDPVFVMACDIPALDQGTLSALYRGLAGNIVSVPRAADGRHEPLFALYRKEFGPALDALIARDERRIRMAFDTVSTNRVQISPGTSLQNINTKSDYHQLSTARIKNYHDWKKTDASGGVT